MSTPGESLEQPAPWLRLPLGRKVRPARFPHFDRPRASIVVLAWRQREHLIECLRSLRESLTSVAYEVIVVLNGAAERVEDALRSQVEGIRFVKSAVNLGFAGGCNLGASVARWRVHRPAER